MAILAECPMCHSKQSNKNKNCKCGEDLDQAKRSRRVRYWIHYQAGGKQQRKSLAQLGLNPYSLEDARDFDLKWDSIPTIDFSRVRIPCHGADLET